MQNYVYGVVSFEFKKRDRDIQMGLHIHRITVRKYVKLVTDSAFSIYLFHKELIYLRIRI